MLFRSAGGPELWKILAKKFSRYLQEQKIPSDCLQSRKMLLHKKNDKRDLKNYRLLCLISQMCKLFTRIILHRASSTLEEQQAKEQAGSRREYSTTDHLFVINRLLERCREYKISICLAFIDYEKAFDNVEINAVLQALIDQGIHPAYVRLLQQANCCTHSTCR